MESGSVARDHRGRIRAVDQPHHGELRLVRRVAVHPQERRSAHEGAGAEARHVGPDLVDRWERGDADHAQTHRVTGGFAARHPIAVRICTGTRSPSLAPMLSSGVLADDDLVVGTRPLGREGSSG